MTAGTRFRVLGAAAAAIGAFALTSTALASPPPKPKDPLIVPAGAIGGVFPEMKKSDAREAWRVKGGCEVSGKSSVCEYGSEGKGLGQIVALDDRVVAAKIVAPSKDGEHVFTGPLMRFRTDRGDLGLGSRLNRVAKTLDAEKKGRSVFVERDGIRMTFFSGEPRAKYVTEVVLIDKTIEPPN